ncbi:hypothetical protein PQR25_30525 [Paraburkholderia nemoris]|uniref:hypothetical protein n=1 Tax=Paraburkholderia nemoris TaxID=2793076 RepID=UPI0038BAA20E
MAVSIRVNAFRKAELRLDQLDIATSLLDRDVQGTLGWKCSRATVKASTALRSTISGGLL